jgi:hypothetical protein
VGQFSVQINMDQYSMKSDMRLNGETGWSDHAWGYHRTATADDGKSLNAWLFPLSIKNL